MHRTIVGIGGRKRESDIIFIVVVIVVIVVVVVAIEALGYYDSGRWT
jgi:hypothetical protein